jgi:uncharacterized phage protein (TIGR02220 family)
MTWAFAQPLAPAPKLVLLALANAANREGLCWPGIEALCAAVRPMQRRQVQRHVQQLAEWGLLAVKARFSERNGGQLSNCYQLILTTIWRGEGGVSDTRGDGENDRGRVSQLRQGEGVIATTPPDKNLEPSEEPSVEKNVAPAGALVVGGATVWNEAEELLSFLNRKAGKRFPSRLPNKDPTASLKSIAALLKRGHTGQQVRQVIANRLLKWGDDPKMREYLRPDTLFRPSKFEQYLGELGVPDAV